MVVERWGVVEVRWGEVWWGKGRVGGRWVWGEVVVGERWRLILENVVNMADYFQEICIKVKKFGPKWGGEIPQSGFPNDTLHLNDFNDTSVCALRPGF